MGYSGRLLGQQLTQHLYTEDVGLLNRPRNIYTASPIPGGWFVSKIDHNHGENGIYFPDGTFLSSKPGHDYNGKVTPDGKVNVEWTDDFQKNLSNIGQAIKVARGLNPNGRITRSKNYQEQIPLETVPASYLNTNHSKPEYVHAQPEITQNMKNPGPLSKFLQKIGPKLGKNFYKLAFAGSVLGMLTFFSCGKNNPISNPDSQDPQPQPDPTTAYINIYANERHGEENITGPVAELWQGGSKVVEGTLSDGYVQLKLTKNLTPNSSGQYDFGNYQARFIGNGYVSIVSPETHILVTGGGSTEMGVKMVNESDIDVPDYRYLWRQQPGNWRYAGPSEIVVNVNQHDLAGTGKTFNNTWMDNFKKIFKDENKIQEITCGYITNITYNRDTNVGHGDPGTDGVFNMVYNSTALTGGVNADYPYNGPASDQTPVSRGICIFNPEKMPDSHSYQRIFHEFFDSLFRLNQNYVASVSDQKASGWSFGSLNGSELLEGYEGLPGWVEVVNGNAIVRGYVLMTPNPDYRKFEMYDPLRHGILKMERDPKYIFDRIEPKEAKQRENEGTKRERIKN